MTPKLQVSDLHAHYGLSHVLQGVSFDAGSECVAVMGRNGVGKTTLVRSIMGLTPPRVTGSIRVFDAEVRGWAPHRVARHGVGFVPQGRRLFASLTVDEHLRLTARPGPAGDLWGVDEVYAIFPRLAERRRTTADRISGGERSMLAIGRALVTNPGCLVLDEPSEGLAPAIVDTVVESLRGLRDEGVCVLLVEQSVRAARYAADRVLFMDDGHIAHSADDVSILDDEGALSELLGVSA